MRRQRRRTLVWLRVTRFFGKAGVTNTGATTHVWGNVGADAANVSGLAGTQVDGTISAGLGVEAAILTAYGELAAQVADAAISWLEPPRSRRDCIPYRRRTR